MSLVAYHLTFFFFQDCQRTLATTSDMNETRIAIHYTLHISLSLKSIYVQLFVIDFGKVNVIL